MEKSIFSHPITAIQNSLCILGKLWRILRRSMLINLSSLTREQKAREIRRKKKLDRVIVSEFVKLHKSLRTLGSSQNRKWENHYELVRAFVPGLSVFYQGSRHSRSHKASKLIKLGQEFNLEIPE